MLIMKKVKLFIMLQILCIGIYGCGLTDINEQIPSVNGEFSWKWVIEPEEYQMISFSDNGLINVVDKEGKYGVFNSEGEVVVPFCYDYISKFNYGIAEAELDGEAFYINEEGEPLWDRKYEEAFGFQEEMGAVQMENLWGFIDNTGLVRIDLQFDDAGNFSEGKAAVKVLAYKEGMDAWAYINESGEIVIDYDYYFGAGGLMNYVGEFRNGVAFVSKDYYSIIDESGNDIFSGNNSKFFISGLAYDPEYDIIPAYIYIDDAMKIRKYGLMNLYGEQRLEPVFDFVGEINGKYVIVWDTADDIRGYYTKGVIELVYSY